MGGGELIDNIQSQNIRIAFQVCGTEHSNAAGEAPAEF